MKLWADFLDYLIPDVPGCPEIAATFALRQSAIAFCEQSLAWRFDHPDIAVVAGVAKYLFVPPTGATVHTIIRAELDGKQIICNTAGADVTISNWHHAQGAPEYILSGPEWLQLVPIPTANATLSLNVALKPTFDATGIDDDMFTQYRDAIVHGALAKLMLSPNKPYTNAQLAQYHQQQFVIKSGQAGIQVMRDFLRTPLQTSILRRGG